MSEVMDLVSELVVPHLIYFGENGITPKVKAVDIEMLTVEEVPGPRLGPALRSFDLARALSVYARLGTKVGFISKYGVAHNDLHTENVVVAPNDDPVIIDWGKASLMPVRESDDGAQVRFWYGLNAGDLMRFTNERLKQCGRERWLPELESEFRETFREALLSPLEATASELYKRANAFGFF
jgi:serine/threonine protein kinase